MGATCTKLNSQITTITIMLDPCTWVMTCRIFVVTLTLARLRHFSELATVMIGIVAMLMSMLMTLEAHSIYSAHIKLTSRILTAISRLKNQQQLSVLHLTLPHASQDTRF